MGLVKKAQQMLLRCDMFKTTEYFRYRGEAQFRTYTGAVCSLLIVIVFMIVFTNAVVGTLNKDTIIWQYNLAQETSEEFSITATTATPAKFMFAVGVSNLDMNSGERYFDLFLTQNHKQGNNETFVDIPLIPCQRNRWENSNQTILEIYDRLNFNSLLCPPEDQKFHISGMRSALDFKYVKITAKKCNASLSTRPCVNSTTLDTFLLNNPNFYLNFYFINTLVNPSSPNEISFYLQDRNYVPFNLQYGGLVNIFVSKYNVQTDESILPNTDPRLSTGGVVNFVGQLIVSRTFKDEYASIVLRKSSTSMNVLRQYTKLDGTLSYIGGLFGFIMIAFIFLQLYTEYAYEVQMGDHLYHYSQSDPLNSKGFNFLTFIGYLFFSGLEAIGCTPNWKLMKKYDECRNEIQKQFDICFLMKRIIFLERSIRILFEDHQFRLLHMHEKMTLKQAQQLRAFYKLRDRMNAEDASDESSVQQQPKQSSNHSEEINRTENVIANQSFRDELKDQFQMKSKSDNKSRSNQVAPQKTTSEKQEKNVANNSSLNLLFPSPINRDGKSSKNTLHVEPDLHNKLKMLRKQSENGNVISRKIYEGFNRNILQSILIKVEQQKQQPKQEDKKEIELKQNNSTDGQKFKEKDSSERSPQQVESGHEKRSRRNSKKQIHLQSCESPPQEKEGGKKAGAFEFLT